MKSAGAVGNYASGGIVPSQGDWIRTGLQTYPLSVAAVAELVARHYGKLGELHPLANERDQVFRLGTSSGEDYVVRVSGQEEPVAALELQNTALLRIAVEDPSLPVPRLCASLRGSVMEEVTHSDRSYRLRLLTFLPGTSVVKSPRSPALLANIGVSLARIDKALARIPAGGVEFPLLWDIRRAPALRRFLDAVGDVTHRQLAASVFDDLEQRTLPRIGKLPAQVIHNDFNPKNILVNPLNTACVAGIIDFGDVVRSARVVDLGVTIARHMQPRDAMAAAGRIIAGYHATLPLRDDEVELLYPVARARLAMRAVIGSWRLARSDIPVDPAQIDDALALLALLSHLGGHKATRQFREHAAA